MKNIEIIEKRKIYFTFSILLVVVSIIFMVMFGFDLSVDFTGGSVLRYDINTEEMSKGEAESRVRNVFEGENIEIDQVRFEDNILVVRTKPVDVQKNKELNTQLDEFKQVSFETVGSAIGDETIRRAVIALLLAFVGILLYIAYAFRNIPKPYSSFRFGVSALIAMAHDVIIVLGVFSLLGVLLGVEIDLLFITALLTVIGFSVNDTIVVFDRIRENLQKHRKKHDFDELVNNSVVQTLRRSLGTSLTVLVVLFSLFFLGGHSIKYFVLAMIVGIISGTYSSIFVASPVLTVWENYVKDKT